MRLHVLSWLSILTVCIAFTACQDHRMLQGQESGFRLKKVVSQSKGAYSSTVYTYSSGKRLASYVSRVDTSSAAENTPGQTTIMQYNAQGQLASAEKQPAAPAYALTRVTYAFDGSGTITSAALYQDENRSGNYTLVETYKLQYGAAATPTSVTIVRGSDQEIQQYTYEKENIVNSIRSGNKGTNRYNVSLNGFQYDDKPNPFYKLITGGPDAAVYNKNNEVASNIINTYNAAGLLIKKVVRNVQGNAALDVTTTFEYEQY
ncbi:hypothetical protein GCM10027341_03590 [Spirosoma knui]